jgi:hypothetical protein
MMEKWGIFPMQLHGRQHFNQLTKLTRVRGLGNQEIVDLKGLEK